MKKILIIILFIYSAILCYGQESIFNDKGKLEYSEVINTNDSNNSKELVFLKAKSWFVETYNSSKAVLEIEDKELGVLMGKPLTHLYISIGMGSIFKTRMYYTIKVQVKKGRCKISIYNIYYKSYSSYTNGVRIPEQISYPEQWFAKDNLYKKNGKIKKINIQYKEKTIKNMKDLIASFETFMKKDSTIIENNQTDDW